MKNDIENELEIKVNEAMKWELNEIFQSQVDLE